MNWKSIKQLFAYYNPMTRKIVGTENDSLIHWHEYRHSRQPAVILSVITVWLMALAVILVIAALQGMVWWLMLMALPPLLLIIIIEIDAWVYAIRRNRHGRAEL